jgi:N-acetylglucosaminyl-diphospho-decaprenol L-rhamnosyltransferase
VLDTATRRDPRICVSVVIVMHNNRDLARGCLEAVLASLGGRSAEVIVVDNGSRDGTSDLLRAENWPIDVISLSENVGFARAVNLAWLRSNGRFLALVNSDAFPDPGCLDWLVEALVQRPAAGIVAGSLRYETGALQPSAGTFPSLLGGLWVALLLHRVPGLSRLGIGYFSDPVLYARARQVDWVSAAVCVARRETGPLPTGSFMYGEDVEWAAECRAAGWEVWLEPRATAVHIGRASVERSHAPGFAQRQRARFELEWFGRRGPSVKLAARLVLVIHALVRLTAYGAVSALRRQLDPRVDEYLWLLRAAISRSSAAT